MSELSWETEEIGYGDDATTLFHFRTKHHPIEPGSFRVCVAESVIDLLAFIGDPTRRHGGSLQHLDPITGMGVLSFVGRGRALTPGGILLGPPDHNPPALGAKLYVHYAWQPPRLAEAEVMVRLPGRDPEWVSMGELRDALMRGGTVTSTGAPW